MSLRRQIARACTLFILLASMGFNTVFASGGAATAQDLSVIPEIKIELTEAQRQWIRANPVVTVAPDPEYAPVEYYEGGGFKGISIDYLNAIGKATGIRFEYIPYSDWNAVLEGAKKGEVHLISAVVANELRSEFLRFTEPFLVMPTKIFIRSGSPKLNDIQQLSGKRIASIKGYSTTEYLSFVAPSAEIVPVSGIEEGLTRLSLGEVDGFIGDVGQVGYYLNQLNIGNVVLDSSITIDFPFNLSVAVVKKHEVLFSIMQEAVAQFPKETFDNIKRKWLKTEWYSGDTARQMATWVIIIVLLSLGLLTFVTFWNYLLQKQVAKKTAELKQELHRSQVLQDQMRVLIDTIPYPIFTKDHNYTFVTVNQAYASFFGKTPMDFEGVHDQAIYHQNEHTPMMRYRVLEDEVLKTNTERQISDYHLVDKDGRAHTYELRKVPFPLADAEHHGILAIAVDISDFKQKEQERLDALNRLVSNIATQINTPLGNIVSSLSYLLMNHQEFMALRDKHLITANHIDRYAESVGEVCDISIHGMQRIKAIMDAFLSLGLIQAKEQPVPVNIYEQLSILIGNRKSETAFNYGVHIPKDLVVNIPLKAFDEVVSRIVDNAIFHAFSKRKDSGEGGQEKSNRIDVYWEDLGDLWSMRICDNGPGVPETLIDSVADPLFSTTLHLGSLGIGLSLVASLVREILKGTLEVKNRPEGGLEVLITIKKDRGSANL